MFKISSIFLTFLITFASSSVFNYCNHKLCSTTGHHHITCTATGLLSPACSSDAQIIELTNADKDKVVHLHNKYRNAVASGNEPGFNSAAKMTTMLWNEDLADYASLNVRRCKFEHDCHNTPEMKYSGQNLFFSAQTDAFERDIPAFIETAIASWWDEKGSTSQSDIDVCCGDPKKVSHFLTMIHEKASRVGCGMSQYEGPHGKTTYIACNYSFNIIEDLSVYESGEAGSKCETGTGAKYPALCSADEVVDWNKI